MSYQVVDSEDVNEEFEVLTWKYYNKEHEGSEIDEEHGFKTFGEAYAKYLSIDLKNGGKMIMQYQSSNPDSEGVIRLEDWTE
jgi:hypothetical protein